MINSLKGLKSTVLTATILTILSFACVVELVEAGDKVTRLSIEEVIVMAVENNLSLKVEKYNKNISKANIELEEGEFDPSLSLMTSESYGDRLTPSQLIGSMERVHKFNASFTGKITTGTTYDLSWINKRSKGNNFFLEVNPYYSSDLLLTLTQPLLKGLGMSIQKTDIEVARNEYRKAEHKYDRIVIDIAADAAISYWDLLIFRSRLDVDNLSLKLAQNIYEEVKAKIDVGVLAPVDIYQTEAEIAKREEAIIKTEKSVGDTEDQLKSLINLPDWSESIEIASSPPAVKKDIINIDEVVSKALESRRDYKELIIEKKSRELLVNFYKNQMLPDLNVFGSFGPNGLDHDYSGALDKMDSFNHYVWEVGLSVDIPLKNRVHKSNYYKSKREVEKINASLENLKNRILLEVRKAWRRVLHAVKKVKATEKTLIAAQKRLEAEEGKFRVGLAILNDVLKFQNEYADALFEKEKAKIDYAKAIIDLKRVKGEMP